MGILIWDTCVALPALLAHMTYAQAWRHLNPNLVAIGRKTGSGVPTVDEVMYLISCWQEAARLNVYGMSAEDQGAFAQTLGDAYKELAELDVSRDVPLCWPQPDACDVVAEA